MDERINTENNPNQKSTRERRVYREQSEYSRKAELRPKKLRSRSDAGSKTTTGSRAEVGNRSRTGARSESGSRPRTGARPESGSRPRTGARPETESRPRTEGRPESGSRSRIGTRPESGSRPRTEGRTEVGARTIAGNRPATGSRDVSENVAMARPTVPKTGSHEIKKRSAKYKKKKQGCVGILAGLVIVLLLCSVAGAFYVKKYGLSKEELNPSKYYELSKSSDMAGIIDNEVLGKSGIVDNEVPYIAYETVHDRLNSRFYWDANQNVLLYTLADGTVTAVVGESQYVKGQEVIATDYPIVKTEGQEVYIAAEYVQLFTNIDYQVYPEPNRIVITSKWEEIKTTEAKKDTQVRVQAGVKSPIVSQVEKNAKLTILAEDEKIEGWTKVCTSDGYVGYTQDKCLKSQQTETLSRAFEEQVYPNITKDYTINMAWHQVAGGAGNDSVLSTLAKTKGLTTIAPTWFIVNDVEGNIVSYASKTYVDYAHQLGIEVWATLNDFDGEINSYDETYQVISDTQKRANIINEVIAEALKNGIDGINVDIENVSTDAGVHFIQFVRELSVKCRQNNIVLSIDNYPPKPYNMHYDYEEQGIVADYVVIMGYDEHYSGALEAGSVSSIGYVEEGISQMVEMISPEKVINALPFYTRLWEETPKTAEELAAQEGTEEGEYPNNVSSQTYGMNNARAVVADAGVEATWDETTKQNYATWTVDNTVYQIWLEDEQSIEAKLQLMKDYNLAGTAAWKLGFEDADIWNTIQKYVN